MDRALIAVVAVATAGVTALLINIFERKGEARNPYVRLVEVGEDDTDPAKWGVNWPLQYDGYQRTALTTRTRFGGHGGSEALPEEKIERDPWLKRMFLGYAFSIDYRDRRGHAYMLADQEATKRLTKPQSGSCLHCHASVMPLYRELGDGDAMKGFEASYKFSYQELNEKLHDIGHAHPVTLRRLPRPEDHGAARHAARLHPRASRRSRPPTRRSRTCRRSSSGAPAASAKPYDPNVDASRNEMRSFVCGQCHVEYYCSTKMPLTFPWGKGLRADDLEKFWDETKFPDGTRFFDYEHAETGAPILKAQHPEFELWSQGIHARSGVSCADCHMPYVRDGATKVCDHWVRSPLLNVNRACQTCHRFSEEEIEARVDAIQKRNHELLQRGGAAIIDADRRDRRGEGGGRDPRAAAAALELQRKAQWRLDFIAAENCMGFHAPQEAARVLGEAIDYARQGQIAATRSRSPVKAAAAAPAAAPAPAKSKPVKKP